MDSQDDGKQELRQMSKEGQEIAFVCLSMGSALNGMKAANGMASLMQNMGIAIAIRQMKEKGLEKDAKSC